MKYTNKCNEAAGIQTMARNLACNSVDAASAVACAEEFAVSAREATATVKRLTAAHIDARAIHLLQDAINAQTLQVNRTISVKSLISNGRSSGIRTSSAATGRFDSVPVRKFSTLPPLNLLSTNALADDKGVEAGGFMSRLTFILRDQTTKRKRDDDIY